MEAALFTSNRDDWETPDELMAVLEREFGPFDLDPCATAATSRGIYHFGPDNPLNSDGLITEWAPCERVFVNPPFGPHGRALPAWVKRCYLEVECGRVKLVVALLPARVDTAWWHEFIWPYATEIRFIRGRVRFKGGSSCATFPSALVVWRAGAWGSARIGPWDWRKEANDDPD